MCVRDLKRLVARKLTSRLREEAQPGVPADTIHHENVILFGEHHPEEEENSKSAKNTESEEEGQGEDAAMTMEAERNSESDNFVSDPFAEDVTMFIEDRFAADQLCSEDV
ncbi:unnamed protein product, partial [Amoebophrya sp. A25]|eukprot:GSA25T00019053001.1